MPQPENLLPFPAMEKTTKKFIPPSIDHCVAYGKVIELSGEECMKFFDRQETIGWRVALGKTSVPMKDWQAAMRTWKRNAPRFAQPMQAQGRPAPAVPLFAQIASLKELISTSRANPQSGFYSANHTAEEKAKLAGWRTRLKELNEQQARGNQQ